MDLNIDKDMQLIISQRVDYIMFTLYHYENTFKEITLENEKNLDLSSVEDSNMTALVVRKDYAIIDPEVVLKVKKTIKLSIRSFLISISLTILNLFI